MNPFVVVDPALVPKETRVSELFYSIQGEGKLAGTPSAFLRLSGCNLRCVWCDTPYASWKPEGTAMMMGPMLVQMRRMGYPAHVVVTGGEPMIAPEIQLITQRLREQEYHITIETAGTVYVDVECDLMSISPKLKNSTPWKREKGRYADQHERTRYQPEVLKKLIGKYDHQLKFVVMEPEDLVEVRQIVSDIGAKPANVMLMAEGVKSRTLVERSKWIAQACLDYKFRYSPRLHVDIWGNERGK